MHTEAPVEQEIEPRLQGLLSVQVPPWLQFWQLPLLHTRSVPQLLPLGALPVSRHSEVPVEQLVMPTLQADGWHCMFGLQATQLPLLHTWPLPQARPLGALPVSWHCEVPDSQLVVPSLQGLPVSQDTLAVQAAQVPLLQTWLVPQLVPLATFRVVSVHWGVPVAQDNVPVWHLFVGVQACPSVQLTHRPPLQTWLLPQDLPAAAGPVSTHTGAPLVQSILPTLQGSARSQAMPALQATHSPVELQTLSLPQVSPAARFRAASLHTGAAPAQSRVPSWRGSWGRSRRRPCTWCSRPAGRPSPRRSHAVGGVAGLQALRLTAAALDGAAATGFALQRAAGAPGAGHASTVAADRVRAAGGAVGHRAVRLPAGGGAGCTAVSPARQGVSVTRQGLSGWHSPLPPPVPPPPRPSETPESLRVTLARADRCREVWRGFSRQPAQASTSNPSVRP